MNLNITYSSEVVPSPEALNMLAIFYDKIYLPHPYGISSDARKIWYNWGAKFDQERYYIQEKYSEWKEAHDLYFKENVLETLPDIFDTPARLSDVGEQVLKRLGVRHVVEQPFALSELLDSRVRFPNRSILDGNLALALHFAYSEGKPPHYIWANDLIDFFGRQESRWEHLIIDDTIIDAGNSTDNLRKYFYTALAKELVLWKRSCWKYFKRNQLTIKYKIQHLTSKINFPEH